MTDVNNTDDIIDSRDVDARIEELESEREELADAVSEAQDAVNEYDPAGFETEEEADDAFNALVFDLEQAQDALKEWDASSEAEELRALIAFRDELSSYCEWRHGATLIRDSYFEQYAREWAEDIHGSALRNAEWPFSCINWERAADELQQDYTSGEFDGTTYWVRS